LPYSLVCERQPWERLAADLVEQNAFRRYYRVEKASYLKLISFVKTIFSLNEEMSQPSTKRNEPIGIEMIIHGTHRYLAE
jgi:hypothetical protein